MDQHRQVTLAEAPSASSPTPAVCPACGARAMLPSAWHGTASGRSFGLLTCGACGGSSSDPIPDGDLLEAFYRDEFSYDWYRRHAVGKARDARERADEMGPWPGRRVLDLGGGLGYLAAEVRRRGGEAVVYDPYADAEAPRPPEGSFDLLVCLHVLEHVPDPLGFLVEASRYLAAGGRIAIAVPNAGGIGYRACGMAWVWAQPPVLHIHHFTGVGLAALLERVGFAGVEVGYRDRWDANSVSDLKPGFWQRTLGMMARVPHVRRYETWRRLSATLDTWRRFRDLRASRKLTVPDSDRAELFVTAILPPQPRASGPQVGIVTPATAPTT